MFEQEHKMGMGITIAKCFQILSKVLPDILYTAYVFHNISNQQ